MTLGQEKGSYRKRPFIFFLTLQILLILSSLGFADTLTPKIASGKLLYSGKVLEMKNGFLSFLSSDGSIIRLMWKDVEGMSADDLLYVILDTQEKIQGHLVLKEDTVFLETGLWGKLSLSRKRVIGLERSQRILEPEQPLLKEPILSLRAKGDEGKLEKPVTNPRKSSNQETRTSPSSNQVVIGEKQEGKAPEEIFLRNEKVSLNKGNFQLELNASYINSDTSSVLGAKKVRSLSFPLTFRYGLGQDIISYLTVPYLFTWKESSGLLEETTQTGSNNGWGDISLGINYQLLTENHNWPSVMLFLSTKSNTGKPLYNTNENDAPLGSGHWSLTQGFSLVRSVDPVVLFGSLSYTYIFEQENNGQKIKPGSTFNLELGTGFAVNQDVSMSFRIHGSYAQKNMINGSDTGATQTPFYFSFSLGKYLTEKSYIEPSVAFGVTPDASDFILGMTYVYKF